MLVFFVWILHLILNIYVSSLNEFGMFGESVWHLRALLSLCSWSIIAGAMSLILCMCVVMQFVFDLV